MSFKAHLIIVSVIIVVVYLTWSFIHAGPETSPLPATAQSAYKIHITHASWGLNCPVFADEENVLDRAYVKKSPDGTRKPVRDNALALVAKRCNGKVKCDIPVTPDLFRGLAPQDCAEKRLEVEYRCFAFDRPWRLQAASGTLSIHCEDNEDNTE